MTTAVAGLIKIGQAGTANFQDECVFLKQMAIIMFPVLKVFFAIELEDYNEKENLLKEIFNKHQVGDSELFALDYDLVRQLLLSFDGKVIYPKDVNKEKEFDEVSKAREQGARFSFIKKGLRMEKKLFLSLTKISPRKWSVSAKWNMADKFGNSRRLPTKYMSKKEN